VEGSFSLGTTKFSAYCMVYSHIWRNIPMDENHLFYIFLWKIVTLATTKTIFKKQADSPFPLNFCLVIGT
jgi:hypothetical protein